MGSGFSLVKQAQERLLCTTVNASEDTTLAVANRTAAYRKANLIDKQLKLNQFTNGAFVSVSCDADAETGTLELWGYPVGGDAEFIGKWTYVADAQGPATDKGYYVDAFTESGTQSGHTVTEIANADSKAVLKFDTLGWEHIVGLITAITGASLSNHRVYLRPW